jgi:hypothetical protein
MATPRSSTGRENNASMAFIPTIGPEPEVRPHRD